MHTFGSFNGLLFSIEICVFPDIQAELLFSEYVNGYIGRANMDGSMYSYTPHHIKIRQFDIDIVDNMLYFFDLDDRYIKRAPIDNTTSETIYTHAGLNVVDIAVDWIGR